MKQREQSLRKAEQEMDSLSFRNQQLAKRVELLQEELQVIEAKSKKGKVYHDWGKIKQTNNKTISDSLTAATKLQYILKALNQCLVKCDRDSVFVVLSE